MSTDKDELLKALANVAAPVEDTLRQRGVPVAIQEYEDGMPTDNLEVPDDYYEFCYFEALADISDIY